MKKFLSVQFFMAYAWLYCNLIFHMSEELQMNLIDDSIDLILKGLNSDVDKVVDAAMRMELVSGQVAWRIQSNRIRERMTLKKAN